MVGIYISLNLSRTDVEGRLELVRGCINRHFWPALVAGDFNAHSTMWGSRRQIQKVRLWKSGRRK